MFVEKVCLLICLVNFEVLGVEVRHSFLFVLQLLLKEIIEEGCRSVVVLEVAERKPH